MGIIHDCRCLVPWRVYHEVKSLEVCPDRGLFDISQFFQDHFEARDEYFGSPREYPRVTEENGRKTFNFTMLDFAEAFFGEHSVGVLTDFLSEHLVRDTEQSNSFIYQMNNFRQSHRFAYFGGRNHYFMAFNFPHEILENIFKISPQEFFQERSICKKALEEFFQRGRS